MAVGAPSLRIASALAASLAAAAALGGCGGSCNCAGQSSGTSATGTSGGAATHSVRLKVLQGQARSTVALVPVRINGSGPYTFALDTGASESLVDKALARKLDLKKVGTARNVSGIRSSGPATVYQVSSWKVGQLKLPPNKVFSTDLAGSRPLHLDGLLGSDLLSRFASVTIDYQSERLVLRGNAGSS